MSHHLDSPLARQDVRLDITDLYVFRGEAGTVLAINVCHSLAGDIPTPGYHPEGRYEFKIDLDDDSVEDLTYRFVFGERDDLGRQRLTVHRLTLLPYVVGTPASFGFNAWNGRSLTDNAPNVMFSIAANTPVSLGIGKESVVSKPRDSFPYVPAAS